MSYARRHITLLTGVAVFVLDQLTKLVVVHLMNLKAIGAIDVVPPYLNFRMAWNRGINFGLFSGEGEVLRWGLILLALVIAGWVAWWVRNENGWPAQVSAGLLVGGALGNVIDRVIYGAVADFLNMSCCGFENPTSFNVADISIFLGAVGLIVFTGRATERDGAGKTG